MPNNENIIPIDIPNETKENDAIFYTTKDLCRILGCSDPTARELMNRPDFPLIKVGKNNRVYKPAFEKWAMERRD